MAATDPPAEVQTSTVDTQKQPNRRQLMRSQRRSADWSIVVCVDEQNEALTTALQELIAARPFDRELKLKSCDSLSTAQLGAENLILVGNRLPEGAESLPLILANEQLSFRDATYDFEPIMDGQAQGPWLKLSYYLNPWSGLEIPRLIHFWYAPDAASVAHCLRSEFRGNWDNVFWTSWAYELLTPHERQLGNYQDTSWVFDEQGSFVLKRTGSPFATDEFWSFELQDEAFDPLVAQRVRDQLHARALSLKLAPPERPIPVYLYPTVESIGLHTGRMDTAYVETENPALHLVANDWTYGENAAEATYLLLRDSLLERLGSENLAWGVARYFSPEARTLSPYLVPLEEFGVNRNYLTLLADAEPADGRSRLFLAIEQLANMFPYLERIGKDHFTEGNSFNWDLVGIAKTYREDAEDHLANLRQAVLSISSHRPSSASFTKTHHSPVALTEKGMTFAHEGYRIYNGYGGSTVSPALDALAEIEVNSIALVPYSFMRGPQSLAPIPVVTSAGAENDHATLASAKDAHHRGWSVLLKPQIWISGYWPGDIDQDSEEGWEQFFYNYEQWILHYAILADRHGLATFCMGTEMRHTTLKQPERWRALIAKVRQLYRGRLTYAANWGEEMEQMTFWPEFDVIGLNAYYPLTEEERPSVEQLQAGVEQWLSRVDSIAKVANRELWLTEVGFRSVEQAWRNPHAEAGEREADPEAQAQAFEALTAALAEQECIGGIYVWKWPCRLGYMRGARDRGFTPYGKPAAEWLKALYTN